MKNVFKFGVFLLLVVGMASCKGDKGAKASVEAEGEAAAATGATFNVVPSMSKVMWEGSKPAGSHNGTVDVASGSVAVSGGTVTGGSFTLDMTSINVLDLEGDEKAYLESHLKGMEDKNADDFFNVNKYPTAKFEITKLTALANDPDATHLVYGNLTMRDVTKQVGFKAKVDATDTQVRVMSPKFTIDRTDWGIKYGSGKFFDDLKDKVISDDMSLQVSLVAKM